MSPSSYWGGSHGWVTISGLKANRLSNVQGILAGEATTAARDAAMPLVPANVLAAWATQQATFIFGKRIDDTWKAKAAETILACGGEIGELPVVQWGGDWLTVTELQKQIAGMQELVVNFEGSFTYDEDEDSMHPRDFKNDFEVFDEVVMVPKHDGSIVNGRGVRWPACLFHGRTDGSRLESLVRQIIRDSWSDGFEESAERRVVGEAASEEVTRSVVVFTRYAADRET